MNICWLYNVIAYGSHRKPMRWESLEDHPDGLTGSDLVVFCRAREMAARGHDVVLYCYNVGQSTEYDGVVVKDFEHWASDSETESFDVAISLSNPNPLALAAPETVRITERQVSEFGVDCDDGWADHVDVITCPSRTAVDVVSKPLPPEVRRKFRVLPNGCYPEQYGSEPKIAGRVAYASSPDRGLHWLMRCWPEIKRRAPHATLRIFYQALDSWLVNRCDDRWQGTEEWRRAHYVRYALERLKDFGVERASGSGGVSHRQIGIELERAEVMAYPASPMSFTETFSVATLEAAAAGAIPVICGTDALGEVHGKACPTVAPPMSARVAEFTDLVVRGLTDQAFREECVAKGRAHAAAHAWPILAERLERIIEDGLAAKRAPMEIRSLERPRFDLVLTEYAAGPAPIDLDDRMGESTSGGCREGFLGLVKALPARGYDVRAYSVFAKAEKRDGVDYRPLSEFAPWDRRDVLLAYYDTSPLIGVPPGSCLRIGSHHTFRPPAHAIEWTDVHVAPSQYTVDAMRPVYDQNVPWYVLPNAVPEGLPEWKPVAGRVIYHTSASRGLHHLLEMWPRIRASVPGATLHVVGAVTEWVKLVAEHETRQGIFARRIAEALGPAKAAGGLEMLGRLPRRQLLRELSEASCFAFPCEVVGPTETFSMSVMECLSIGVPVVMIPQDALGSVYVEPFNGPIARCRNLDEFKAELLYVLKDSQYPESLSESGKRFASKFTFANAAEVMDKIVRQHLPARERAEAAQ